MDKSLFIARDTTQFVECTKAALKQAIKQGEISSDLFTAKQLQQIIDEVPYIDGLTWHHHQVPGKMQLVISDVHKVNHLGGNKLWGGGIR